MGNILRFLPFGIIVGLVVVTAIMMFRGDDDTLPSAFEDQMAPPLDVVDFPGATPIRADMLAGGQVTLVNFWASWCAPCRAEHPNLMALAAAGVPIIGVNYRDSVEKAQAFLDELGDPFYALGQDPRAKQALEWGVYGLPETFVLGPDGAIITRIAGPLTNRNLESRLRPALAEKGLTLPDLN